MLDILDALSKGLIGAFTTNSLNGFQGLQKNNDMQDYIASYRNATAEVAVALVLVSFEYMLARKQAHRMGSKHCVSEM